MEIIEALKWRYATKKFDSSRKISQEDLEKIKKAVQLSASSFGLQLYSVLIIENEALREKLKSVSFGQPQITEASHLFVFCNYSNVDAVDVDKYVALIAKTRNKNISDLEGFGDVMKGSIQAKSEDAVAEWTVRQTYIALGTLLTATAELRIDACPMEGFQSEEYNKILGLNEKGLNAAVIATIGYRSPEDPFQHEKKVRRPQNEIFKHF